MIVPHRGLYYLPFQALHDGKSYLIERREVSFAPSAVILQQCLARSEPQFAARYFWEWLMTGFPVYIRSFTLLTRSSAKSSDIQMKRQLLRCYAQNSAGVDVIHLACHAQFRSDNPLFSALKLGDGWFTARTPMD